MTKAARAALLTAKNMQSPYEGFVAALRHARATGGRIKEIDELLGKLTRPGSGYSAQGKPSTVKIPGIGDVESRPIPVIEAAARKFTGDHAENKFSPFNEDFARRVANAFDRLRNNPNDPKVKRAYDALIDETLSQYHALRDTGLDFKFLKPGQKDPYAASPSLGYADLVNKGRLFVYPTERGFGSGVGDSSRNPLLKKVGKVGDLPNATANDAFRLVHDAFGHYGPGNPYFRAPGEERAYQLHSKMYSPTARAAAATETRGQNSWVNYGPAGERNRKASAADTIYAPQTVDLLPDWAQGEPFKKGGAVKMPKQTAPAATSEAHPAWIPTRLITSKKVAPVGNEIVDLASLKSTPELYAKNVDLLRSYPNLPKNVAARKSPDAVAEAFVEHVKDNLLALHDAVPPEIRQRSQRWYDGARAITDRWSQQYGLPDHSVAGALAALSPQKDWYQNVSLAERVLNAIKTPLHDTHVFDDAMRTKFKSIKALDKPEYKGLYELINGKRLVDFDGLDMTPDARAQAKALWVRLHDETYSDRAHRIVTPEGDFGDYVKTQKGANAGTGWGSLTEIGKAIRSIEAANDPALISQLMGEKHKVRNFYNNILSPNSPHGDVTIDTHAVAAGLLRPLSGNSLEVAHNFANYAGAGQPNAGGSAISGVQGTYPLYAEAYRRAAAERGILPRQMQSITWEAVRGLFPDTFKTAANNSRVNNIWQQHRAGKLTQAEARSRIYEFAGGIRPPSWWVAGDPGVDAANRGAGNAGELPQRSLPGQSTQGVDSGAGGRPAAKLAFATGGAVVPTEAQKVAGNYRKKHVNFQGLDISIENEKGSTRSGTDADGKRWSCVLPADYGYIKRTEGADGDQVDVYVGPHKASRQVFIINQHRLSGGFDEHKVMLGFNSEREAIDTYVRGFSDGKGRARVGSLEPMSIDAFKDWLKRGKTTSPARTKSIVDRALALTAGAR